MNAWQARLLNAFQRDFPVIAEPYAALAAQLDVTQTAVLAELAQQQAAGVVSRVGAVVRPHTVGYSTLAALAVSEARLETVARQVSALSEVNHNYQREHAYNLWFVLTAPTQAEVHAALARLAAQTQLTPIELPMQADYHIDLGFDWQDPVAPKRSVKQVCAAPAVLAPAAQAVLLALAQGLPLHPQPYAQLGATLGLSETVVLEQTHALLAQGLIKRLGIVVRHHELGFKANAMAVWDIPDAATAAVGAALARAEGVHLCYQRRRCLPQWPYNLFCMLHGQDRAAVLARLHQLNRDLQLQRYPQAVLFSLRRYKQCGAHYGPLAA